ncbi:MAG: DUF4388 domain-containing protein [Myxococcota bacterium]|nr:DUF4388 domain-containing protein [Myxococcota bacterium]
MISGRLGQAGVGGVLQECSRVRLDGAIRFWSSERRGGITLSFNDGRLVDARPDKRAVEQLMGERLVREGTLSRPFLKRALCVHKKTQKRLGDVLAELGLVDPSRVQRTIDIQCQDTLYELFEWQTGEYEQLPLDQPIAKTMSRMSMDSILAEGFRRLEEWPVIRARLSNYKVVFEQVASAQDKNEHLQLNEAQRSLLSLVDGRRTVFQLIQRSGLGEFSAVKALASLMSRGLIKIKKGKAFSDDPMGHQKESFGVVFRRLFWNLSLVGCVLVVLVSDGNWFGTEQQALESPRVNLVDPVLVGLELAEFVETYRALKESYPDDLDALTNVQLFLPDRVAAARELGIELISIGSDYEIRVRKEDGHVR